MNRFYRDGGSRKRKEDPQSEEYISRRKGHPRGFAVSKSGDITGSKRSDARRCVVEKVTEQDSVVSSRRQEKGAGGRDRVYL